MRPGAHDIPTDVTIHAFVRPVDQRLELIVRAPIAAMRDVVFPTRPDNMLDVGNTDGAIRHAAMIWIADGVAIFGPDRKLIFNNKAFADMWGLDPAYLLDKPDHGSLLDRLRERRKLPARPWRHRQMRRRGRQRSCEGLFKRRDDR